MPKVWRVENEQGENIESVWGFYGDYNF